MGEAPGSDDDRAVLTLTAWSHGGVLLGVIRWRASLAAGTEVVTSAGGVDEIVAVINRRVRELDLTDGDA